jgi:hypothetical protein
VKSFSYGMKAPVSGKPSFTLLYNKCLMTVSRWVRPLIHHSLLISGWSTRLGYQWCRLIQWTELMIWWQKQAPVSHSQTVILILVTDQNTCYCARSSRSHLF